MSHLSKIRVEIKSLSALRAAALRLGGELHEGQTTFALYRRYVGDTPLPEGFKVEDWGKCQHAVKFPGAKYEVGVVQDGDHYALLYDYWSPGGLQEVLGQNAERLVQAYAVEASREAVQAQGFSVLYEEQCEDGSVRLHVQAGG